MKLILASLFIFLLSGCSNPIEEVYLDNMYEEEMALEPTVFPVEEELTYIEMLVGMQEFHSARLALDNLLFTITDEFEDELIRARINDMIMILEDSQLQQQPHFTGAAAVAIAMERFGVSPDFSYFYHENPSHFGPSYTVHGDFTRSGFYVAIKSTAILEADPEADAILMMLFVADDGTILEMD